VGRAKGRVPDPIPAEEEPSGREPDGPVPLPPLVEGVRAVALGTDRFRRYAAAKLEVNVTELTALGWLENIGDQTPSALARYLGVGPPGMTAVVSRLERLNYVRRRPNPADRRSTMITLTPAGRHAIGWVYDELTAEIERGLDAASERRSADADDGADHGADASQRAEELLVTLGRYLLTAPYDGQ